MNKISKGLTVSAIALTVGAFGVASVAPVFAIVDGGGTDLNGLTGSVAGDQIVQITGSSVLTLDVNSNGQVESIAADGTATALSGAYGAGPADITIATPGTIGVGYSNQIIKSNNTNGYAYYLMACNTAAGTNYGTVKTDCHGVNLSNATQDVIAADAGVKVRPVVNGSGSLTGTTTANVGGFWGYQFSTSTNGSTAAEPTGNYLAVPAFSDTTPYGTKLLDTATGSGVAGAGTLAGASAVNTKYSVVTNNQLPTGTYNTYVIYTAVAN